MPVYEGLMDTNTRERYTKTSFAGCVLGEYERNGRDDSDFYAIVWDEDKREVRSFEYNSTRYAGGGSATVDATPEVIAKSREFYRPRIRSLFLSRAMADAKQLRKDDHVVVVKGRKVPKGTTGIVFWIGESSSFGYGQKASLRIGVRRDDGDPNFFIESTNLEVAESVWHSRMKSDADIERDVDSYISQDNWYSITEGTFYMALSAAGCRL